MIIFFHSFFVQKNNDKTQEHTIIVESDVLAHEQRTFTQKTIVLSIFGQ